MKLKQQIVSLELAKKLKELGVKQESLFVYYDIIKGTDDKIHFKVGQWTEYISYTEMFPEAQMYSAFTVAELGEMLPDEYPGDSDSNISIFKVQTDTLVKWYVRYENDIQKMVLHAEFADTEADARAKMLIYLLENKLINRSKS